MPLALFVAFVVMPIVEIWTILQVGSVIGAWWTVVLLVLDSLVGAWLVRREGARSFRAFQDAVSRGGVPGREIADGALILVGGALMLTPGFVTDVLGALCVLPPTRAMMRGALAGAIARRVVVGPFGGTAAGFPTSPRVPPDARRPGPGPSGSVVQGEVVDDD